jgi:hypothetical protein
VNLLQLRVEQRAGRVFGGWEEGQISFPPTYKYLADSDTYAAAAAFTSSANKKRTPAWYVNPILLWYVNVINYLYHHCHKQNYSCYVQTN